MTDPWYFQEIPALPSDASDEQARTYFLLRRFVEGVALRGDGEIPFTLKAAMRAYLSRWHPKVTIPPGADD